MVGLLTVGDGTLVIDADAGSVTAAARTRPRNPFILSLLPPRLGDALVAASIR
jgi:hypothetical protein